MDGRVQSAADPVGGQSGTVQLGTTFGPGVRQQAFVFDGVDDYVSIPDSAVLDSLSTNATLDAWIKPEIPLGAEAWLFARRDPFVSEGFSVALLQDGRIQLTVRTTTSPTVSGSTFRSTASVITFDQWQHVAAAVDTVAGTAQIWVNGQAVSLTAVFGPATLSGTLFNVNQQYLGRRQDHRPLGLRPRRLAHHAGASHAGLKKLLTDSLHAHHTRPIPGHPRRRARPLRAVS